ncbi:NAD-dependent epimerase/dehydratase family protein [Sunxiuqinia sp. A32]|uniref:NAD-dependent epimerase/dehydratase family protein n=1 Tax=Sunxiuqinia sp. A32 TaxID=3461496 RepID=UPI004045C0D3
MKILVTGANGLLGSNLIRKLLQKNIEAKAFVRPNSNLLSLKGVGVEIFKGNILNHNDLQKALKDCQAVVHAAANTSQWPNDFEHYEKINIHATQLLLEESRKEGIDRFIHVSSANVFGPGTKENPGNEHSPFTLQQSKSGYMQSKYVAQKLVLDFAKKYQFPATVVNPTFMLGKYDAKPSSGQMLLMAYGKKLMPCPRGGKNFIHVEDVSDGIINAIAKGKNGSCYLFANENLSYNEFFGKMRQVCGYPQKQIQIPKPITDLAGNIGSIYENLTTLPAKLNRINSQLLVTDNYYSAQKAITELGLKQTRVEIAIQDALEWFDEFDYLK